MKSLFYWVLLLVISVSCNFQKKGGLTSDEKLLPNNHKVTVTEVLQTNSYTYLKLKEENKEYWAAVAAMEAKPGQTYYYLKGMEMTNFKSKELNRTFESIYFIDNLSEAPLSAKKPETLKTKGRQMVNRDESLKIEPVTGGITISTLMANKSQYEGKTIKVKGKVIKFSPEIMNKNWVHLQDGTEASGEYDLVITTNDKVNEGDVVTFEGKITLNKDFGYGYKYGVLMEEAKVSKE